MARELEPMTSAHIAALPGPCGACASWQVDLLAARQGDLDVGQRRDRKCGWFDAVEAEHGRVGWVLADAGRLLGHILYAPAVTVPRVDAFPTAPPSGDAVVVVGLWAEQPALYKPLVQRAVKDCRARGIGALEAFGGGRAPRGCQTRPATGSLPCRFPNDVLDRLGFRVVRDHPASPRYRLDVGGAIPVLDHLEQGVAGLARALGRRPTPEPGVTRAGTLPRSRRKV